MDKFLIDGHKYSLHPEHASKVTNFIGNPNDESYRKEYKNLHPLYIEVSPVGACNHRCTFCAVDYIGYKSIFLDTSVYKKSIDSMVNRGCKSIMFAGEGEPLLHPDMADIVNYTKDIGGIDTSFTTNAFKLSENFISECMHNISWIKISFNGGNPDTYSKIHRTNKKDFEIVSENIKRAVEYKEKNNLDTAIGLQTLLLPDNRESIDELCIHAKELGVDYVVIKPYSQHKFSNTHRYENIDYKDYLELGQSLSKYNSPEFNVIFRINTINNWIKQNEDRYCRCLATPSTWAYWMADGSVYSCSAYLLDERFKLGNINDEIFNEIWASDKRLKHSDFVLNHLDINECRVNCRMDQVNRYLDTVTNNKQPHINFI